LTREEVLLCLPIFRALEGGEKKKRKEKKRNKDKLKKEEERGT
jgi:hypothetical protein